jgi:hypothetical protein
MGRAGENNKKAGENPRLVYISYFTDADNSGDTRQAALVPWLYSRLEAPPKFH